MDTPTPTPTTADKANKPKIVEAITLSTKAARDFFLAMLYFPCL